MDKFGEWLVAELKRRRMTQSDLARSSGLSEGTISNIISGRRGRGIDSIKAIAEAFKIPTDAVLREAGVLPSDSNVDKEIEEIAHLAELLSKEDRNIVVEFIRLLDRLRGKKK